MKITLQYTKFFFLFIIISFLWNCDKNELSNDNENTTKEKLPLIKINTFGEAIVDEPKIDAYLTIEEQEVTTYEGGIGIEFRGASSQSFPKKSYGLETRDENNDDLSVSLLDFHEEEDWILYGPYSDKSLIRNRLIYHLSNEMNRYASRCKFVELTINNQYQGLYVFMEKLKRDKNRIDINKLNEDENTGEDVTGGYILKIDKTAGNNLGDGYNNLNSFRSQYPPNHATSGQQIHFLYEYPKAEDITTEQKQYISTYISEFENKLASAEFADPVNGYTTYIDVDSFIDFFILNELSNNVDGYRLSTFMFKDKNDKLNMGPIWDFNLAFGNANYCGGGNTNVWAYKFNERCSDDFWQVPFWWERLLEDPNFVSKLKTRWNELSTGILSEAAIISKIDSYKNTLTDSEAITHNFTKWNVLGIYVWPNNYIGNTYEEELNYLKGWIHNRHNWLHNAINSL
ncbi:MAG: CotH kinase family protein [Flavobacteriaceae bacterium]|nr:CotH kinase family protein [Flavobacteriaceae bacterium]